jgi:hypothetical protein
VDLLAQHHAEGRRFEPVDFLEQGPRVAVRLEVTDPHWSGRGEVFKVFTFSGEDRESPIVLLQDTRGEEHARELLAQPG